MTAFEAYLSLNSVGIGSRRLKCLLEYFGSPQNIIKAPLEKLAKIDGIGTKLAQEIAGLKKGDFLKKELTLIKKYNLVVLTPKDKDYPQNLKTIYDPPIVLYLKGKIEESDNLSIAVVGSRRASFYGLSCAEKFASELSAAGLTIVSGMARGIDTAAHKGALKYGKRTIAVMGSGFAHIYPPENRELAEEISRCGAIISEFPIDTTPLRQNFPRRNRVISGLSLGVLVVEAARNSGALITADFALEQGREVFALPGRVDINTSFGTNGLIKQGAKLVSSVEDILEELNLPVRLPVGSLPEKEDKGASYLMQKKSLSNEEAIVYNLLSCKPLSLDEILEGSKLDLSRLMSVILQLEVKRLVSQLPGRQFIRSKMEAVFDNGGTDG